MKMKTQTWSALVVLALFLWAGMLAGISFLEAPVKFTAPNITLALGLGIGRLVFGYLNKIEIILCSLVWLGCFLNRQVLRSWLSVSFISIILAVQTVWLLPALDVRALAIMAGETPPASMLHFIYVALELIKFGLLLGTGLVFYRQQIAAVAKEAAASFYRDTVFK